MTRHATRGGAVLSSNGFYAVVRRMSCLPGRFLWRVQNGPPWSMEDFDRLAGGICPDQKTAEAEARAAIKQLRSAAATDLDSAKSAE